MSMFIKNFLAGMTGWKNHKRLREQWPQALLLMAGALKSGLTVEESFAVLMQETAEPLRSTLQAQFSADESAWLPFEQRIARIFADPSLFLPRAALLLTHRTGGSGSELLERAAALMWKRIEMKEKKQTLTVQSRVTAWIVGVSPLCFLALLATVSPGYVRPFFCTRLGHMMLMMIVLMLTTGIFVIRKIMQEKQ